VAIVSFAEVIAKGPATTVLFLSITEKLAPTGAFCKEIEPSFDEQSEVVFPLAEKAAGNVGPIV
jgi:hypothetical protein